MSELSQRTLDEMAEGARNLRKYSGCAGALPDGYLDEIMKTQARAHQLRLWESAGRIRVEYGRRSHTSDKNDPAQTTMVYVRTPSGEVSFCDPHAQEAGAWPSEYLIAEIALCMMANEGKPYEAAT